MKIQMKKFTLEDGEDIYRLLQDLGNGENGFELTKPENYNHYQEILRKFQKDSEKEQPANRVPQDIFWMYVEDVPVGVLKLRYSLTSGLLVRGGNVGYSISPTYRNKGYGNLILKEALALLKQKGLQKILITANEKNTLSRRVIEWNGGILEDIQLDSARYWIEL